jgi:Glycosyl hydrolases family 18
VVLGLLAVVAGACGGSQPQSHTGGGAGSTGAAGTGQGTGAAGTGAAGTATAGAAGTSGSGSGSGGSGTAGGGAGSGATAGASGTPDASADTGTGNDARGGSGGTTATGGSGGATGTGGRGGAGGGGNGSAGSGTGGSGTGGSGVAGTSGGNSNFPARVTAPYVETWSSLSLTNLATATGHKFYTLAFMISNGCTPSWNGDTALSSNLYATDIANLRKMGGDVIISFGGASGVELGDACTTVDALQAAYQAVITKYALSWMDLDIEGGAESRTAAVDRRNKALKNLQTANPGLRVSYTLAVDPSGLPQAQRNLLANAKTNGLRVDVVNVMAMDYGACNLDMGKAATDAAAATRTQLQTLGLASAVGVTPMTGVNDTTCENFSTANATALVDYANANAYVGLLAFWAVSRDVNHAYLNIFKTFH